MKANIPRSLASLSPSERKKLEKIAEYSFNKDVMIMLDIYLKMSCAVLHDAFGTIHHGNTIAGCHQRIRRLSINGLTSSRSHDGDF